MQDIYISSRKKKKRSIFFQLSDNKTNDWKE